MSEQVTKPVAQITASPVPLQAAAAANLAGVASEIPKTPVRNVAMTEAVELSLQEFLLNPVNLSVLDATIRDNYVNTRNDMYMVLDYVIQKLMPPNPTIHNEIVGGFRNQEPGNLLGALASALERSESAHEAYSASLTVIKGIRVQINLNLSHIPRFLVRLSDLTNSFLTLDDSASQAVAPYRASVQDMINRIKAQQLALTGALFDLDRIMRLYGQHLLLQSYTHFLRDPHTQAVVQQGHKPPMTGLSTTAYPLT
jgi:hypothetical protein